MTTSGPEPSRAASAPPRPCRRLFARRGVRLGWRGRRGAGSEDPPRCAHHALRLCPGDRAVRVSTSPLRRRRAVRVSRATRARNRSLTGVCPSNPGTCVPRDLNPLSVRGGLELSAAGADRTRSGGSGRPLTRAYAPATLRPYRSGSIRLEARLRRANWHGGRPCAAEEWCTGRAGPRAAMVSGRVALAPARSRWANLYVSQPWSGALSGRRAPFAPCRGEGKEDGKPAN